MTDHDLRAVYEYLSAIPHAEPGSCSGPGQEMNRKARSNYRHQPSRTLDSETNRCERTLRALSLSYNPPRQVDGLGWNLIVASRKKELLCLPSSYYFLRRVVTLIRLSVLTFLADLGAVLSSG
jgi:hypothetical protein